MLVSARQANWFPLVQAQLLGLMRERSLLALLLMWLVVIVFSIMLGAAALAEEQAFSLTLYVAALRWLGVLSIVVVAASQIQRAFDHREIELLLATPLSRPQWLFSQITLLAILALFMLGLTCLPILWLVPLQAKNLAAFALSLYAEWFLLACAAVFFALASRGVVITVLASMGFYVLSRLIGPLLELAQDNARRGAGSTGSHFMELFSWLLPRLDAFAPINFLLSDAAFSALPFIILQTAIYSILLILLAALDLQKRQF